MVRNLIILNTLDKDKNVQVSINNVVHSVTGIVAGRITLEDNSELEIGNSTTNKIADKWNELMEINYPHIYEKPVPISDSLIEALKQSRKKWLYYRDIDSLVRRYSGVIKPEQTCWCSNYNPRDNDYYDSTHYYSVVVYDNSICDRFKDFLKKNGLYERETKTTIHFK